MTAARSPAGLDAGVRCSALVVGARRCAAVAGIAAVTMVGEILARSSTHPMVPGRWVPSVLLALAGAVRLAASVADLRWDGRPLWLSSAGLLLPAAERSDWLAEVVSVLHAEAGPGRGRQA